MLIPIVHFEESIIPLESLGESGSEFENETAFIQEQTQKLCMFDPSNPKGTHLLLYPIF